MRRGCRCDPSRLGDPTGGALDGVRPPDAPANAAADSAAATSAAATSAAAADEATWKPRLVGKRAKGLGVVAL